jgi:hypothetical protein
MNEPAIDTSNTPAVEPISATEALASLSETERAEWRKSGTLPDTIQSPLADSTPAEPDDQAASTDALPEAASEPAPVQKSKGAKARTAELDAEITELQSKLALRAQLREELARGTTDATSAASSPAPAAPVLDPSDPEPDPAKYDGGEYDPKYLREIGRWEARQQIKSADAVRAQQAQQQAFQAAIVRVTDAGRKAHADYDAVMAAAEAANVRFTPAMVQATFTEANGQELAYLLATDRDLFHRIAPLPLLQQEREIGRVLARLESPGTAAPSPKTVTDAPAPPTTLGSRPATPADAVESAIRRRDQAAYNREQNAREMAGRA